MKIVYETEIKNKHQWKLLIYNKTACVWATTFNDALIWEERDKSLNNLLFFMILFAGSLGIGYLADRSKSLVICALFHSFNNIFQDNQLSGIQLNYTIIIIAISALFAIFVMRYNNKQMAVKPI